MVRETFRPYNIISDESIRLGEWYFEDGTSAFKNQFFTKPWDPFSIMKLKREVIIDNQKLKESASLSEKDLLRVVLSWHSLGTDYKYADLNEGSFFDIFPEGEKTSVTPKLKIMGNLIGTKLLLQTSVILLKNNSGKEFSATVPGSILWDFQDEVIVEGDGSFFPTIRTAFGKHYSNATWYLDIGDLNENVSAALTLYLNEEKKEFIEALNGDDDNSKRLTSFLRTDIARQMIMHGLADDEFRKIDSLDDKTIYEEDTIGAAIFNLIKTQFSQTPAALFSELNINPLDLEKQIQHKFLEIK